MDLAAIVGMLLGAGVLTFFKEVIVWAYKALHAHTREGKVATSYEEAMRALAVMTGSRDAILIELQTTRDILAAERAASHAERLESDEREARLREYIGALESRLRIT